jgi:glycyl-tRNA synthetase
MFLSVLSNSFGEEKIDKEDGSSEIRTVLKIHPALAPIKAAILPLIKKDGLPEKAYQILNLLKFDYNCQYEEKDSIGKRYRRHDAIGTPFCITIDHQTLEDNSVTIRYRDTMLQERISVDNIKAIIEEKVNMRKLFEKIENR